MDNATHIVFNAEDRSYFAILKKEIHNQVAAAEFSTQKIGEVDIIVAEITSNLFKHAGGGEILVKMYTGDNPAIEIISIDNGPGMADPIQMTRDGISTSNTLGHGLGAMQRLSDDFQIYSLKDWGTVILCRVYKNERSVHAKKVSVEIRNIVVAKPGETMSGDGSDYILNTNCLKIFLGDGLGHGPEANLAVQKAITSFNHHKNTDPVELIRSLHLDVKKTRGLVGTVAIYDFSRKIWQICGIGNIATKVQDTTGAKAHLSYNGIIGLNIPNTLKAQEVPYQRGQIIIMCSDGIRTRWELSKYPNLLRYDLSILAAVIYKDQARKTDDMSVLACRINSIT